MVTVTGDNDHAGNDIRSCLVRAIDSTVSPFGVTICYRHSVFIFVITTRSSVSLFGIGIRFWYVHSVRLSVSSAYMVKYHHSVSLFGIAVRFRRSVSPLGIAIRYRYSVSPFGVAILYRHSGVAVLGSSSIKMV